MYTQKITRPTERVSTYPPLTPGNTNGLRANSAISGKTRPGFVDTEHGEFDSKTFFNAIGTRNAIARIHNASNAVMAPLDVPQNRRGLISVLIGLSCGNLEFKASHLEIGKKLYPFDESLTGKDRERREKQIRGQVKDEIKALIEWELKSEITLVEYAEGGKVDGDSLPSKFKLPILSLIQNTLLEFPKHAKKSRTALADAARIVVARQIGELKQRPPKTRQIPSVPSPERQRKSAITFARKYADEIGDACEAYSRIIADLIELRAKATKTAKNLKINRLETKDLEQVEGVSPESETTRLWTDSAPLTFLESQGGAKSRLERASRPDNGDEFQAELELVSPVEPAEFETSFTDSLTGSESVKETEPLPPCDSETVDGEARRAFEVFLSVDANPDEYLFKDDEVKEKESGRKITPARFGEQLEELVADARQGGVSFIARLRGPVLQIDDCTAEETEFLRGFAFLQVETSKGNFQSWLAFADEEDKAAARDRLFERLRQYPGTKMNSGSNGAIRWPGSINFKPGREQWCVRIVYVNAGRIVTPAELEDAGLLADSQPKIGATQSTEARPMSNGWPAYEIALAGALKKDDGTTDASQADARFVTAAIARFGHGDREQIAAKLREVSPHAREEEPESYATKTVNSVADFLRDNRGIAWA